MQAYASTTEGIRITVRPLIPPGVHHDYNSICIVESMEGFMDGTYLMQRPDGSRFSVAIPRFILRAAAN